MSFYVLHIVTLPFGQDHISKMLTDFLTRPFSAAQCTLISLSPMS